MKPKRLLLLLLSIAAGFVLAGRTASPPAASETPVDIDLAKTNRTMVYSQVFDMLASPRSYCGKTVRMAGTYATTVEDGTTNRYHACLISDATACCAQGIEFVATNAVAYPQDFPEEGTPIVVQGVFDTYEENGHRYPHVRDAVLSFHRQPSAR